MFDWLLLNKFGDKFLTSDFQFGFKPESSTVKCTFSLSECIHYFTPDVYVLLLDCSKAFDKVNYVKLFRLLYSRGLDPMVLRCLIHLYTNQHLNVSWDHCSSKYFSVMNGVKQGGVLSPMLFSIYINDLLLRLENSPFGCKVGHLYAGAFAYADDVALVAPSLPVMSKMCDICLEFASEFFLTFNPSKCKLITFGDNLDVSFTFNGTPIPASKSGIHLGHVIGQNCASSQAEAIGRDLTQRVNALRCNFHYSTFDVKRTLFSTFCTSYYGLCLLNLDAKEFDQVCVTWRKCLRFLFDLPPRCHSNLIPLILSYLPFFHLVASRLARFIYSCHNGSNTCTRFFVSLAARGSRSPLSQSLNCISSNFDSSVEQILSHDISNIISSHFYNSCDEVSLENAGFAVSVLHDIDFAHFNPSFLNAEQLKVILNDICTA